MRLPVAVVALALLGGGPTSSLEAQAAANDSVTVRLSYAGRFTRTRQYSRLVSLFARVLPRKRQQVTADSTLEQLIFSRYNVSAGPRAKARGYYLPEIVDSIRRKILQANGLDRRTEVLRAGTYEFPLIPAQATWNSRIAQKSSYGPHVLALSAGPPSDSAAIDTLALASPVSPSRIVEVRVPRKEAAAIAATLDSVGNVVNYEISAGFRYRYGMQAGGPPTYKSNFPDSTLLANVRALLAQPKRRVPLVILDTYWPSDSTGRASCAKMAAILSDLRTRWKIGPPSQPECGALSFSAPPPPEQHSALVFQSIVALQRVSPGSVDVIFLPMGSYQGAGPLLAEIVRVQDIVENKLTSLTGAATHSPWPDVLTLCEYAPGSTSSIPRCAAEFPVGSSAAKHAQDRATSVIGRLPSSLAAPNPTDLYRSATDLLIGTMRLLGWYALGAREGAVVSASWTTDLLNGNLLDARQAANVLLVAAAGNERLVVTNEPNQVDFGRRVATREPVLAAIDVDSLRATTCSTSVVDTLPNRLREEFAASIDGYVSDACGTSFSAPRIAWFAAAAESLRPGAFDSAHWVSDLMGMFERSRTCRDEPNLRDIALDPVKLLTVASGKKPPPDPRPANCDSP